MKNKKKKTKKSNRQIIIQNKKLNLNKKKVINKLKQHLLNKIKKNCNNSKKKRKFLLWDGKMKSILKRILLNQKGMRVLLIFRKYPGFILLSF